MKPPNTTKVHFREVAPSDFLPLYSGAFSVPEVTKHLQWETHKEPIQTKELIEEMIDLHQQRTKYYWVAVSPTNKRIVGLGSMKPEEETVWLGFLVYYQEQRKGFGSAVLEALEASAFNAFERLCAAVDSKNESSRRLLENSGWAEGEYNSSDALKTYEKCRANKAVVSTPLRRSATPLRDTL